MRSLPDGYTLALEASTYAGSVAVVRGAEIVFARDVEMRGREEERLMPAVADCIAKLPGGMASVQRVVCGAGPGSFTSLRIAASIAKGICHARGLPLYAVSSLALVVGGSPAAKSGGRYMVSLEAMREKFGAVLDAFARRVHLVSTDLIAPLHGFEDMPQVDLSTLEDEELEHVETPHLPPLPE